MCYPSSEPCSLLLNALAGAGGARQPGGGEAVLSPVPPRTEEMRQRERNISLEW